MTVDAGRHRAVRNVLIVFATREGQTEKIANRIAEHLVEAGAGCRVVNADDNRAMANLDLALYDRIVLGASMHAGGLERELIKFVDKHAAELAAEPVSFFLVLLSAATRDPVLKEKWLHDAHDKLTDQVDLQLDEVEMFAGALAYSKYPWPLRWLMQRIARRVGEQTETSRDYEYTDWQQVARYAQRLLQ